jgi:hypothetical protein
LLPAGLAPSGFYEGFGDEVLPRRSHGDERDSRWKIPVEAMRPEDVASLIDQAHLDAAIYRAILDGRKKRGIKTRLYSNAKALDSWLAKFWDSGERKPAREPQAVKMVCPRL